MEDVHLTDGHLRQIDERPDPMMLRDDRNVRGGFQIGPRDRHRKTKALTAFDGSVNRHDIEKVAYNDFSALLAKQLRTFILDAHMRANTVTLREQHLYGGPPDRADLTSGTGDEDW
jgi:hypothetical protein